MQASSGCLRAQPSYILDALNLCNILTGNPFYTNRHPAEWEWWRERLSPAAHSAMAEAQAAIGSHMLGPRLTLLVSAVPNFESLPPKTLLSDIPTILSYYRNYPYYEAHTWPQHAELLRIIGPIIAELEQLGLPERWHALHLPQVEADVTHMTDFVNAGKFDLVSSIADMLGRGTVGAFADIQLYVCAYAAPHGIKLCGRKFITSLNVKPRRTLQAALHEMFHPPYETAALKTELDALIADPLFRDCWQRKDPIFGYDTELAFLEENVVEAVSLLLGERLGVVDDPVGYLVAREGDVYRMAVVLYDAMLQQPKCDPDESFATYFCRVVSGINVGHLTDNFQRVLERWKKVRG